MKTYYSSAVTFGFVPIASRPFVSYVCRRAKVGFLSGGKDESSPVLRDDFRCVECLYHESILELLFVVAFPFSS